MGAQPALPPKTLAAEIRKSEAPFLSAVSSLVAQVMKLEYPRLRGYAIEGGTDSVEVSLRLMCKFGEKPRLSLVSVPRVVPREIRRDVQLDFWGGDA